MHTLYWIPRPGDVIPRLMAFDDTGRKVAITGARVKEYKNALMYRIPETEKNRHRMENVREPWHRELPTIEIKTKQETVVQSVSPSIQEGDSENKVPITRTELYEILENNGISFRKNLKSKTLFEKLPDDIARNFKLVKPELALQT